MSLLIGRVEPGHCRYCGEKMGLVQRLSKAEFCSGEHKDAYVEAQARIAMERLTVAPVTKRQALPGLASPGPASPGPLPESEEAGLGAGHGHQPLPPADPPRESPPPMAGFLDRLAGWRTLAAPEADLTPEEPAGALHVPETAGGAAAMRMAALHAIDPPNPPWLEAAIAAVPAPSLEPEPAVLASRGDNGPRLSVRPIGFTQEEVAPPLAGRVDLVVRPRLGTDHLAAGDPPNDPDIGCRRGSCGFGIAARALEIPLAGLTVPALSLRARPGAGRTEPVEPDPAALEIAVQRAKAGVGIDRGSDLDPVEQSSLVAPAPILVAVSEHEGASAAGQDTEVPIEMAMDRGDENWHRYDVRCLPRAGLFQIRETPLKRAPGSSEFTPAAVFRFGLALIRPLGEVPAAPIPMEVHRGLGPAPKRLPVVVPRESAAAHAAATLTIECITVLENLSAPGPKDRSRGVFHSAEPADIQNVPGRPATSRLPPDAALQLNRVVGPMEAKVTPALLALAAWHTPLECAFAEEDDS